MKKIHIAKPMEVFQAGKEKTELRPVGLFFLLPALQSVQRILPGLSFEDLILASATLSTLKQALQASQEEILLGNEEHKLLVKLLREFSRKLNCLTPDFINFVVELEQLPATNV